MIDKFDRIKIGTEPSIQEQKSSKQTPREQTEKGSQQIELNQLEKAEEGTRTKTVQKKDRGKKETVSDTPNAFCDAVCMYMVCM